MATNKSLCCLFLHRARNVDVQEPILHEGHNKLKECRGLCTDRFLVEPLRRRGVVMPKRLSPTGMPQGCALPAGRRISCPVDVTQSSAISKLHESQFYAARQVIRLLQRQNADEQPLLKCAW